MNKDEKLLARFKNYNNFLDRQSRQRPTFGTIEQFRQVARPYFPKAFLDNLYRPDTLGLASIQIDKILAFQEVPFQSNTQESKEADDMSDPYRVLHEPRFDHKLNKLYLAISLYEHNLDDAWNFYK